MEELTARLMLLENSPRKGKMGGTEKRGIRDNVRIQMDVEVAQAGGGAGFQPGIKLILTGQRQRQGHRRRLR